MFDDESVPGERESRADIAPAGPVRRVDDPVHGVVPSLDEMVHGVGGIFDGLDEQAAAGHPPQSAT